MKSLMFGRVLEGFIQFCPIQGELPVLEKDRSYEIFVSAGAYRGRREFKAERRFVGKSD